MIRRSLVLACLALASSVHAQRLDIDNARLPAPKPAEPAVLPTLVTPPGVLGTEIGKTVSRPAAKPGTSVDLFAFIGEAGAMLHATASGAKSGYGVTIYTPEGAEMLTETGLGSAKLTAALPQDAVYILAVTRQNSAEPYKLALAADPPDMHLWDFRVWTGYEDLRADGSVKSWTCWTKPGETMRSILPDGRVRVLAVSRGGSGHWDWTTEGKARSSAFTTVFADGTFTRTYDTGDKQSWTADEVASAPHGKYRGYLCP